MDKILFTCDVFEADSQSCIELIKKLSNISSENLTQINREIESICERFEYLITKWQTNPKLIEKHMNIFLKLIIDIITNCELNSSKFNASFRLLTRLVACVGHKSMVKYFPTEVFWFTKLIVWIEKQNSEPNTWQTRFGLLLWLSMAVKTPFHLSKFDDNRSDNSNDNTIIKRIDLIVKKYIIVGDKCRDCSAWIASNFYSRPEIVDTLLTSFMNESIEQIQSLTSKSTPAHIHKHLGYVMSVARLFKVADRKNMIEFGSRVIETVVKLETNEHELIAKWKIKLIGRSALTLLTPRIAKWRYRRGRRFLNQNLFSQNSQQFIDQNKLSDNDLEVDDDPYEIPEQMEIIIEALLTGLHDPTTTVRWSAAKYIARLTNRLPKELAADIVTHVLQLCEWRDSEFSWHGCCLALAELSRRGLILTHQLPDIIHVVEKALIFDEIKGSFSVGSNVRDAACFVCWSLSRAYEPQIIEKYVQRLAPTLVCVTCFDREVNCRRAASAAIQELVGRTQTFPHGIDVVLLTDFHELANRNHCYLNIAFELSLKKEFSESLVQHLITKCVHWDRDIREIASQAIGTISTIIDLNVFLPEILTKCKIFDLNSRHGCILAVAEIIGNNKGKIKPEFIEQIESIALFMKEKSLLKGIGGEFMKHSLSVLIAKCSAVLLPIISKDEVFNVWVEIVCDSITSEDQKTRKEAVIAISNLTNNYLINENQYRNQVLTQLTQLLFSPKESSRIGSAESLQLLSHEILENNWKQYFTILLANINCKDLMCTSRAAQVVSVVEIGLKFIPLSVEDNDGLVECLCNGLDDRTNDSRGDIGGNVRIAAIKACLKFIDNLNNDQMIRILNLMITECVSIWKKGRETASNAFKQIIFNKELDGIDQSLIRSLFDKSEDDLEVFIQLLKVKTFTYNIWRGLVTSIANPTEVKFKQLAKRELRSSSDDVLLQFLNLFENSVECDRLSNCCINCFHFLLTECPTDESLISNGLTFCWFAIRRSKDVRKIVSSIDVFCAAIQLGSLNKSLSYLTILLCHRFPRVRSVTANQTYVALLTLEDINQQVITYLTETDWTSPVDQLKPIRDQICDLLHISKPIKVVAN